VLHGTLIWFVDPDKGSGSQTVGRPDLRVAAEAVVTHPVVRRDAAPPAWEKQVLSARGFKRVGRHSEYAINGMKVRKKRPRGFR
jgi:hypothetical protein